MSLTPGEASAFLRESFQTMTEEEFVRLATKDSPPLLDGHDIVLDDTRPQVRLYSPSLALSPDTLAGVSSPPPYYTYWQWQLSGLGGMG